MRLKSNRLRILRQQGYTLMLVLLLLGAAVGAALFSFFSTTTLTLESDQKTADALASAKAALIGRAVTDGTRPGSLPCPDVDDDGLLKMNIDYFGGGNCASNIGRLPWRTLDLPDLRDAGGERLWYAVSPNFRDATGNIINSDTRGSLKIYAGDGSTVLTNEAVAVIFAPGAALGGQTRDGPNLNVLANYLETVNGINNAATSGPFIAGSRSDSYNDRVVYITTPEFIPIVEQRAAKELKTALQAYYNSNGSFPPAAAIAYTDTSGTCVNNLRRGRVPSNCTGTNAALSLPSWFTANKWWQVMYYSVASGCVKTTASGHDSDKDKDKDSTPDCTSSYLTVGSNASVPALFFTPGTPLASITRPSDNLHDYLENVGNNTENRDGWSTGANDIYVTPSTTPFDRDRIYTLAGGASTQQCANNAATLVANAPCGGTGNTVISQCSTAAANLIAASCSCSAAATTMVNPPCTNTLNPPQCQSAVAALKSCTSSSDTGHDDDKGKDK